MTAGPEIRIVFQITREIRVALLTVQTVYVDRYCIWFYIGLVFLCIVYNRTLHTLSEEARRNHQKDIRILPIPLIAKEYSVIMDVWFAGFLHVYRNRLGIVSFLLKVQQFKNSFCSWKQLSIKVKSFSVYTVAHWKSYQRN
jgi:hypothetical protein